MSAPKARQFYLTIGEREPFLRTSKACYERVMRALLVTGSHMVGSCCSSEWDDRNATWIASVVVPADQLDTFKRIAKCSFTYHIDIVLGYDFLPSLKWVDEDNKQHIEPHPEIKI